MDARKRLIGGAAYLGFFGILGVALMVYFGATSQDRWIVLASVVGAVYFAAGLVLVGLVVAHALKRAEGGSEAGPMLEPRFQRSITLATVALLLAASATLFAASVLANMGLVAEGPIGLVTAFVAIVFGLDLRDYRRKFPRRSMPRS
ncbi:MAG TPA: hypothetical protein VEM77_03450 [Thermoplasmata archaeon]|nr:hypothetical protein [Thermoplasmata archaeon]